MAINAGSPGRIKSTSITTPTATQENHTLILGQLKETTEIAQRLRGDPLDSFVTVGEVISALGARLVNKTLQPPTPGAAVSVAVANSITGLGTTGSPLQLINDVSAPGNSYLYGTSALGVKGWFPQPTGGSGSLTVTDGTHSVTSTTQITVVGAVVSGTTPNATITISGTGGAGPQGPAIFLVGEDGPEGEPGRPGLTGNTGPAGLQGPPGQDGDTGDDGAQGPPGNPGAPGQTGAQGPSGVVILTDADPGDDGMPIPGQPGVAGQTGAQGPAGPAVYLDAEGLDGEPGPPGPQGPQGPAGSGATGAQGPTGPAAYLDAEGLDGEPGPPGPQGPAGINGTTGAQGPTGPAAFLESEAEIIEPLPVPGPQGLTGPTGGTGAQGPPAPDFGIMYQEMVLEDQYPTGMCTVYPGGPLTVNGLTTLNGSAGANALMVNGGGGAATAAIVALPSQSNFTLNIIGGTTAGSSNGFSCTAGSNSSDLNGRFLNSSSATILQIRGDGALLAPLNVPIGTTTQLFSGVAKTKTTATTSANATLTADAALTVTINETGWYQVEVMLFTFEATLGTGGFQANLAGGTAVVGTSVLFQIGGTPTAQQSSSAVVGSSFAFTSVPTSSASPGWMLIKGTVNVTTAGTFGVEWAQAVTTAGDPTTLMAGSYIVVTKIG